MSSRNERITSTLESLTQKVESLENEKGANFQSTAEVVGALDKLVKKLDQLGNQQAAERDLAGKLERVLGRVEKLLEQQPRSFEAKQAEIEDTLKKGLRIAKLSGQIVEILAGSLQVAVDAIVKLIREQNGTVGTKASSENTGQPDLSNLLSSISKFIQELAPDAKKKE